MLLEVEGFQSIAEKTSIKIDGFVTLTGESNTGKTAFFRALKAFLTNRKGTRYVTKWKDKCTIKIVNNGHEAVWEKSGDDCTYTVDGQLHQKAGKTDPSNILSCLGLLPVKTSSGAVYWPQLAKQGEHYFIIGEASPTVTAELLGTSEMVQQLVRSNKLAIRDLRTEKTKQEVLSSQTQRVKTRLNTLVLHEPLIKESREKLLSIRERVSSFREIITNLGSLKLLWTSGNTRLGILRTICNISYPKEPISSRIQILLELSTKWKFQKSKLDCLLFESPLVVPPNKENKARLETLLVLRQSLLKLLRKMEILA